MPKAAATSYKHETPWNCLVEKAKEVSGKMSVTFPSKGTSWLEQGTGQQNRWISFLAVSLIM